MQLQHLRSRDVHDRFDFDERVGAVTVILGLNAVGKSTLLRLVMTALNPGSSRTIPVVGSASGAWTVEATFDDVTVERTAVPKHAVRIDGALVAIGESIGTIKHRVGSAHAFDLSSVLAMSEARRRDAFLEHALAGGLRPTFGESVPVELADRITAQTGLRIDADADALHELAHAYEKTVAMHQESKREATRLAKALEADQATLDQLREAADVVPLIGELDRQLEACEQAVASARVMERERAARCAEYERARTALARWNAEISATAGARRRCREQADALPALRAALDAAKAKAAETTTTYLGVVAKRDEYAARLRGAEHQLQEQAEDVRATRARVAAFGEVLPLVERMLRALDDAGSTDAATRDAAQQWIAGVSPEAATAAERTLNAMERDVQADRSRLKAIEVDVRRLNTARLSDEAGVTHAEDRMTRAELVLAAAKQALATAEAREPQLLLDLDQARAIVAAGMPADAAQHDAALSRAIADRDAARKQQRNRNDLDAHQATMAERRARREAVLRQRTALHELRGDIDNLRGAVLESALRPLLAITRRIVHKVIPGADVGLAGGSTLMLMLTPEHAPVPIDRCSSSERAILLAALRAAVASTMTGWRHVLLDDLEHVHEHESNPRRTRLVAALRDEIGQTLDNVLLACVDDGWTPPHDVHVIRLTGDA